jgi:hypothetical protein
MHSSTSGCPAEGTRSEGAHREERRRRDQSVANEALFRDGDVGRTVDVAVALALSRYGSGARGCPDTPAVVIPNDDLNVCKSTRIDVHDV